MENMENMVGETSLVKPMAEAVLFIESHILRFVHILRPSKKPEGDSRSSSRVLPGHRHGGVTRMAIRDYAAGLNDAPPQRAADMLRGTA